MVASREEPPEERPDQEEDKKEPPQEDESTHGGSDGIGADGQRAEKLPVLGSKLDALA